MAIHLYDNTGCLLGRCPGVRSPYFKILKHIFMNSIKLQESRLLHRLVNVTEALHFYTASGSVLICLFNVVTKVTSQHYKLCLFRLHFPSRRISIIRGKKVIRFKMDQETYWHEDCTLSFYLYLEYFFRCLSPLNAVQFSIVFQILTLTRLP